MERKNEHHEAPMPGGIGASLKSAREAAGLGLGEVADRLKLSLRQLEAIERDDFDALPGATFVRGFVRNYARFLDVDPEPLMRALEHHFPSAVNDVANLVKGTTARETAPEPEAPAEPPAGDSAMGKWLGLAALAVVVVGGSVWFVNRDSASRQPDAPESNQLAPMLTQQHEASAVAASAPAQTAASAAMAQSQPQASAPAKAAIVKPVASAPANMATAKPQASSPAAQGADKVSVNVKDAAWISVQDATGRKLIYKVLQPGEPTEVSGTAPFKVVVGNAGQVELRYNGKPVDFSDKIRGTTAKIQLK